ncbi:universal stress protein [Halomicroarcula sp. GCM10025324]|uniref:universal stress protein n=1 Tax=Haloarcula TaxID=2237 RepID=UPI0023E8096C|nr:universal stress protein [Halomicroarcula sp. ZS-22-S1]
MYDQILIPTDGGDVADTAAEVAITLAGRFDATLHVVHVSELGELPPGTDDADASPLASGAEAAVTEIAEAAADAGLEVATAIVEAGSSVHGALLAYVERHDVDCLVMGTHGRSGVDRVVFGSVAERTVRESPVPVLTVHAETVLDPDFSSILVPTDGSRCARTAVDHAIELADLTGATLHLLNVVNPAAIYGDVDTARILDSLEAAGAGLLEDLEEVASDAGLSSVETTVTTGTPHRAIRAYADDHDIDCIAMGTHGRTGVQRYLLGSVTSRVIRLSDVPVLAIPGTRDD